jgi:hypothetical protein
MTATVAPPTGDQFGVLLAIFLVITFATVVVLWVHEWRWDRHEAEIAIHHEHLETLAGRIQSLADFLGVDVHDARDDSPQALAEALPPGQIAGSPCTGTDRLAPPGGDRILRGQPDDDTEEFPAIPATEPSGIPLAVQSALLRPSPVPRGKSAEWVEEALEELRARNTERMARTATKGD